MANMVNLPSLVVKDMPLISFTEQYIFQPGSYSQLSHHKRWRGGDWILDFKVYPSSAFKGATIDDLEMWFYTWLMHEVVEVFEGFETWSGVIWEMELIKNGVKRRRRMDDTYTAVKAIYLPVDATVWLETAYYVSDAAILKYGRREYLLYLKDADTTFAQTEAQTALASLVEPTTELLDIGETLKDCLSITCVGKWFTLNNRYTDATLIGTDTISNLVIDTLTDVDFVTQGNITPNPISIEREMLEPVRAGDYLMRLAAIGGLVNGKRQPWRVYVKDNKLHYGPAEVDPLMEWRGLQHGYQLSAGQSLTWGMEPGVVRDYTVPKGDLVPESFLLDARDTLAEEIRMSEGSKYPKLSIAGFGEDLMQAALEDFERWTTDYNFDTLHTPVGETPPPHPKHNYRNRHPIKDIHV